MKASKIAPAILALLLLTSHSALFSQVSDLPANVLADLKSDNMDIRETALERLESNPETLRRPGVRKVLVDLLDQANRETLQALQTSNGDAGIGEAFGEYAAHLNDTVTKVVDWRDPNQVCILAQSAYNPGSQFSVTLATKSGAILIPCVLKMAQGIMYGRQTERAVREIYRDQAIPLIVEIAGIASDLSPANREHIHNAILGGLQDSSPGTRLVTVDELGRFGIAEFIPILQDIAHTDPYSRPINEGKDRRFDVREAAVKAIQSIQDRTKTK
jgi:hypothetical protein